MSRYNQTPATIDTFTRIQAEKFQQKNTVTKKMAFLAFFGIGANMAESRFTDDSTNVAIEVIKNNDKISVFGERGVPATLDSTRRQGYKAQMQDRQFPIIKETGAITAEDTYLRVAGEANWTGSKTQKQRMLDLAFEEYHRSIIGTTWKMEKMAAESIIEGTMEYNNNGDKFDFQREAGNMINVTTPWTDPASKPLDDIDAGLNRVQKFGLADPDMVGMDVESYAAFIEHASVANFADNRRYFITQIGETSTVRPDSRYKRFIEAGWQARAYVTTPSGFSAWIFTYNGWYKNESGVITNYMPKGTVICTSTGIRADRYFGPSDKLPEEMSTNSVLKKFFGVKQAAMASVKDGADSILDPRMYKFFANGSIDNSQISLELQAAPIFACTQVDAVATLKLTVL
jgi:hypothetical protein